MKKISGLGLWMILLAVPGLGAAAAPHEIAGFVLGKNIAEYREMVKMETALPIRYAEYLKEVEIRKIEGYKSGIITYGTCDVPGRIVRISLKYADSTEAFYKELLARYRELFGKPDEWRGDAFQIVMAWKWSFTDSENNHISAILQHNVLDVEQKLGNAVKLTIYNLIEKERLCYEKKYPDSPDVSGKAGAKPRGGAHRDWKLLLPR